MKTKSQIIGILSIYLFSFAFWGNLAAQNPGERCDPSKDIGYTARIVAITGTVNVYDDEGIQMMISEGSILRSGSTIKSGIGDAVELLLEDGTESRSSRLRIEPGSELVLSGGLYCDDLRPKFDEGRWTAREINIKLIEGGLNVELAQGVSSVFNIEIRTPNAVAQMQRRTQEVMKTGVRVSGLDERTLVPVIEHPKIREQLTVFLMGRNINDLSPREKDGIMTQAATTAIALGLVDIEAEGLLDNPQIRSTVMMMTQGKNIADLDENERNMVLQGIGTLAISQGLLDPNTLKVYDQPDEYTYIAVHAGTMRVYNAHRGYKRDEVVNIEAGMFSEVRGYNVATHPSRVQ